MTSSRSNNNTTNKNKKNKMQSNSPADHLECVTMTVSRLACLFKSLTQCQSSAKPRPRQLLSQAYVGGSRPAPAAPRRPSPGPAAPRTARPPQRPSAAHAMSRCPIPGCGLLQLIAATQAAYCSLLWLFVRAD